MQCGARHSIAAVAGARRQAGRQQRRGAPNDRPERYRGRFFLRNPSRGLALAAPICGRNWPTKVGRSIVRRSRNDSRTYWKMPSFSEWMHRQTRACKASKRCICDRMPALGEKLESSNHSAASIDGAWMSFCFLRALRTGGPGSATRQAGFFSHKLLGDPLHGASVRVDIRWAGDVEFNTKHAMELLALAPDVFLAAGAPTVRALQKATRTVPIVFTSSAD